MTNFYVQQDLEMILIAHYIDFCNPIDGNLLNQLDYYIFLKLRNIDIKFFIFHEYLENKLDPQIQKKLNILIDSRYNLSNIEKRNIKKDILYYFFNGQQRFILFLKKQKINYLILTDQTYDRLFNINKLSLNVINDIFIIRSWYSFYNKLNLTYGNAIILNENELCGNVNYLKKVYTELLFNDNKNNNAFILANGERKLTDEEISDISHLYSDKFDNIFLCSNHFHDISKYPKCCFIDTVSTNRLFELFSTYIYVPTKTYEFAPKMLLESIFLGKSIIYYKYPENINKRFEDIKNNDIEKYKLTKNDKLFQMMGLFR